MRIYIDSNAGVRKALAHDWEEPVDTWMPLGMGFYDEGTEPWASEEPTAPVAGTWQTFLNQEPTGANNGSVGIQFQLILPYCTIMGVQVWIPPYELSETSRPGTPYVRHGAGEPFIVRLWEGGGSLADDNVVAIRELENPQPGWNNIMFDPYYPAKTAQIPNSDPTFPYDLIPNPEHDGWYTVGYQSILGGFFVGPLETSAWHQLFPRHRKVYMTDNSPAASDLVNRFGDAAEKGPEWAPAFNIANGRQMVGPIINYVPIYPLPKAFRPQIYRRVVTEAV